MKESSDLPLVSAIITTHNRLDLLKRAIDSAKSQTYANMEIIVVDDCSKDGTKEYCENLPGIRYIYIPKEESRGGNYARNLGIKASNGKYVAFLDDDDYWLPEKTAKQVEAISTHDCELVYCLFIIETVDGSESILKETSDACGLRFMSKSILYKFCSTSSSLLIEKQALVEIGMFDENLKFWQDHELIIRLAQRKPFYCMGVPLAVYRSNISDQNRLTNKYFEWRKAVKYIKDKHAVLYESLALNEKIMAKILVYGDAYVRCKNSNLNCHKYYYALLFSSYRALIYVAVKVKKLLSR